MSFTDIYVVTRSESELSEGLDSLQSTLFLVLESVTSLELLVNELRQQASLTEASLRKTDC